MSFKTESILRPLLFICLFTLAVTLSSCGGGGGSGSDEEALSTNACGTLGLNARIINGTACSQAGSPVVELSFILSNGTGGLCSGSMISSTHVLTAAHCFLLSDVTSAFIEVGGRRVFGSRVFIHPRATFDPNQALVFNDVAILQLESAVSLPTLPLITSRPVRSGDIFGIFGFGLDQNGGLGVLRSSEMRVEDVSTSHIAAAFEGDGGTTCNGDSGGPAIYDGLSEPGIIGIVSSGTSESCSVGDTAFFANAQSIDIFSFIKQVVGNVREI